MMLSMSIHFFRLPRWCTVVYQMVDLSQPTALRFAWQTGGLLTGRNDILSVQIHLL